MACAASVRVGPAAQVFWALYTRVDGVMRERTRIWRARGAVELAAGEVRVRDAGIELALSLEEDDGWEARCHDEGGGDARYQTARWCSTTPRPRASSTRPGSEPVNVPKGAR